LPKPSASITCTIFRTRVTRSGFPWGIRDRCETFAAVKSMADAFGHAAAHAPQPMHAAASMERSASCFGIGIEFASGAEPAREQILVHDIEHFEKRCVRRNVACFVNQQFAARLSIFLTPDPQAEVHSYTNGRDGSPSRPRNLLGAPGGRALPMKFLIYNCAGLDARCQSEAVRDVI